ncbi:MAG: cupin domain-containing protein [Chloroflexi bacterium]|nr:MAG: cupin domain-containing protein [Chloroflexota bacterium]MBL1196176.1 cupin domain-containing protein [Chloroflexota bacterium]NOH13469.1 cupin domain-containing protein [Chloroflexota bacterium]
MFTFEIEELLKEYENEPQQYNEFLRVPAMSIGIYQLAAGSVDPQSPHDEDEVYYVLKGKAKITVGEKERPVGKGSIVYVAAREPHKFHSITEDLTVMVFFAPAES